ncbi:MAG: sugar ABC transporter ATP-binding protein [Spirochaetales bacterium]|nr:sugar ABC transporter ATP-binding protein [Spirochaetales bacterium]
MSKSYVGVQALRDVSLTVAKGSVHCLVGENGSGKSTLIKAIAGVIPIDSGQIIINGNFYTHLRAIDSIREGIQVIYQDLSLFPNLTIAENISLNQMVEERRRIISWREMEGIARSELERIGIRLDVDQLVEDLSMANRQLVAIVRALTQDARLIIMDEPTTALTKGEIDSLFSLILDLKNHGISTLFVSHKLSEVLEISERVAVLRDGLMVGDFDSQELDSDKLAFHMTGKEIVHSTFHFAESQRADTPVLELRGLSKGRHYQDIGFSLYPGEILGITGLLGSGRTELALSLFGLNKPDRGQVLINGKPRRIGSPREAIRAGISYLPEDRHTQGLFLKQAIGTNLIVTVLKALVNRLRMISQKKKTETIQRYARELRIKAPSLEAPVESLSGGNQQRVVLAKWLATSPKILLLDGPTVGIDIASKSEIHQMIKDLAHRGMGIIMISDEISEVFHNCNRIMVMKGGRITEQVDPQRTTEEELVKLVEKKSSAATR